MTESMNKFILTTHNTTRRAVTMLTGCQEGNIPL